MTINYNDTTKVMGDKRNGSLDVNIQDLTSSVVCLYLYILAASTTLASNSAMDDETITVTNATGFVVGDAITIYEGNRIYQSIIKTVVDTTIGLASPLDYAFTTSCVVEAGSWNIAKDGSVTTQIAYVKAPPLAKFDLYQTSIHITDNTPMDSATFGGITALSNGVLFRVVDGFTKNLPLITNNSGFQEIGFEVQYDPKAPSGFYGMTATKNCHVVNGVAIRLDGSTSDLFQLLIRDDLSTLESMTCTINGHVVDD